MQGVCYLTAHDVYLHYKKLRDVKVEANKWKAQVASEHLELCAGIRLVDEAKASTEAVRQLLKVAQTKHDALQQANDQEDYDACETLMAEISANFEALQQLMKLSRLPAL